MIKTIQENKYDYIIKKYMTKENRYWHYDYDYNMYCIEYYEFGNKLLETEFNIPLKKYMGINFYKSPSEKFIIKECNEYQNSLFILYFLDSNRTLYINKKERFWGFENIFILEGKNNIYIIDMLTKENVGKLLLMLNI